MAGEAKRLGDWDWGWTGTASDWEGLRGTLYCYTGTEYSVQRTTIFIYRPVRHTEYEHQVLATYDLTELALKARHLDLTLPSRPSTLTYLISVTAKITGTLPETAAGSELVGGGKELGEMGNWGLSL